MTEDEALTKWCPFVRSGVTANERTDITQPGQIAVWGSRCIASACMAWRWKDPTTPHLDDRDELGGHCGLAGAP